jgi:hypothetical protein
MKSTNISVGAATETRIVILDSGEEAFAGLTNSQTTPELTPRQ